MKRRSGGRGSDWYEVVERGDGTLATRSATAIGVPLYRLGSTPFHHCEGNTRATGHTWFSVAPSYIRPFFMT